MLYMFVFKVFAIPITSLGCWGKKFRYALPGQTKRCFGVIQADFLVFKARSIDTGLFPLYLYIVKSFRERVGAIKLVYKRMKAGIVGKF